MAALGADVAVVVDPESSARRRNYKATGTLTFYRGGIASITIGTGTVSNANADADTSIGVIDGLPFVAGRAAVAGTMVAVYVSGCFWFACANFSDVNLWKMFAETAGSDNPADITLQTTGTTGTLGMLEVVDATGVSGWLDISQKAVGVNA